MDAASTGRELLTSRLRLRPLCADDLDELVRLQSDPEVMRYISTGRLRSREECAAALASVLEHWERQGYGIWAMLERDTGAWAGQVGLRYHDDRREAELLYALHKEFWGRGLTTEAAEACVRYGFEVIGLPHLFAVAWPENAASRRVMEKLGMRYQQTAPFNGVTAVWYTLTPLEFAFRPRR
jgi:ribosomal-protein-alanine N-acetyltransferase